MTNITFGPRRGIDHQLQHTFHRARAWIAVAGVAAAALLVTLVAVAAAHGGVTAFMWTRAVLLLTVLPVLYFLTHRAERGSRASYGWLRRATRILPIVIVVVDLIPGACPGWYAAIQAVAAVALLPATALLHRRAVRAAFGWREWRARTTMDNEGTSRFHRRVRGGAR